MGNFNDRGGRDNRGGGFRGGNRDGGRPSFGGNRGGDRGPVTMHKAVCDECHKSCEVPFRPSSDKPIYCNDCFSGKRGNEAPRREFNNDRGPKREFNDKPSQSSFTKPTQSGNNDDIKKQLSEMNSKLDRLANAIKKLSFSKVSTPIVSSTKPEMKVITKATVSKVVAKKAVVKAPVKKIESKKAPVKKAIIKKGKK